MTTDVTKVVRRLDIREILHLALEDLVQPFGLKEEISEKGMELLREYNLISLTDMDEFERSFFRSVYANITNIDFQRINEEIMGVICYTFDLSLNKNPILMGAIEKAEKEEQDSEHGIRSLLLFYTCQQFYRRMKNKL